MGNFATSMQIQLKGRQLIPWGWSHVLHVSKKKIKLKGEPKKEKERKEKEKKSMKRIEDRTSVLREAVVLA